MQLRAQNQRAWESARSQAARAVARTIAAWEHRSRVAASRRPVRATARASRASRPPANRAGTTLALLPMLMVCSTWPRCSSTPRCAQRRDSRTTCVRDCPAGSSTAASPQLQLQLEHCSRSLLSALHSLYSFTNSKYHLSHAFVSSNLPILLCTTLYSAHLLRT